VALTAPPTVVPQVRSVAVAIGRPALRPEPEVLVAPNELRGLRQLATLVREGRMQFVFSDEASSNRSAEPVGDIVITPLAIAPIEVATNAGFDLDAEGDEQ
jgi:hypothetical protein